MPGWWRRSGSREAVTLRASTPISTGPPIDSQLRGLYDARLGRLDVDPALGALNEAVALSVPSVAACLHLITGTVAQLDVRRSRAGDLLAPGALLTRPDPDTTWIGTITPTVSDLLFYGRAYWLVLAYDGEGTERNPLGLPVRARHVPAPHVAPKRSEDMSAYTRLEGWQIGSGEVPPERVIAFDTGRAGVLWYGARTLSAAVQLEAAALRLSGVELPAAVLKSTGQYELSEEDAKARVAEFQAARRDNGVAFLQGVDYERTSFSPADLQLIEARALIATEVARLFNVPVALISASPSGNASSMLYQNLGATQASLLTMAVAPVLRVIEAALSGDAVSPRGQVVSFNAAQWLRADPGAAIEYAIKLVEAEIADKNEARAFLGFEHEPTGDESDLQPGRV